MFEKRLKAAIATTKSRDDLFQILNEGTEQNCAVVVIDDEGNPVAITRVTIVSMGEHYALAIHTTEKD